MVFGDSDTQTTRTTATEKKSGTKQRITQTLVSRSLNTIITLNKDVGFTLFEKYSNCAHFECDWHRF